MAKKQTTEERAAPVDIRAATARQGLALDRLRTLAPQPPQSLVLEGGTDEERKSVALFWAALLNCEASHRDGRPCLQCSACRQIADNSFSDLIIMDEAYYEEKKSRLSVAAVRNIMPTWGQPPSGDGYRVTIFPNIRDLSEAVSNTLLKSFEEPRPGNVFMLLAPQRERLLPTLVSRSWVLTLAWPEMAAADPEAQTLARAMVGYWSSGRGWYEHTQAKLDAALALGTVNHLAAMVRDAMSGKSDQSGATQLARTFDAKGLHRVDLALAKAQEALSLSPSPVNPALVLDWVASAVKF